MSKKGINWRYAIGEVAIVMIGITLAFSLNNLKSNLENNNLQAQYLENLKRDSENEIAKLTTVSEKINQKINLINEVRPFLGDANKTKDSVVQKVFQIARRVDFTPENTTYLTLINSGDLKLIEDFDLRKQIESHYLLHDEVMKNYSRVENIYANYLGDFFIKEIDYDGLRRGNTDFLKSPLLKNILNSIQGAYYFVFETNKKCIESNTALIDQLNKKIQEFN